ncbi:hypothetical protein [Brevibacillus reuszeri]|uniref:hypothetical protein n=1 Tax=Brevibacillus reuszeri TaxID=54915 RepID=UPI00289FD2C8|nr:hypothetical protein [Brevibacillus reuszeri]
MNMFEKILVAIDKAEITDKILEAAVDIAQNKQVKVTLFVECQPRICIEWDDVCSREFFGRNVERNGERRSQ